jgi:hypothetical protein
LDKTIKSQLTSQKSILSRIEIKYNMCIIIKNKQKSNINFLALIKELLNFVRFNDVLEQKEANEINQFIFLEMRCKNISQCAGNNALTFVAEFTLFQKDFEIRLENGPSHVHPHTRNIPELISLTLCKV